MLQFGDSLTDNTSIVIYDRIVFMTKATGFNTTKAISLNKLKFRQDKSELGKAKVF